MLMAARGPEAVLDSRCLDLVRQYRRGTAWERTPRGGVAFGVLLLVVGSQFFQAFGHVLELFVFDTQQRTSRPCFRGLSPEKLI